MKNFFTRKGVRVVLGIFIVFLLLVLSRVPVVLKKEKSQETVGFIESVRLTMQDVDGSNLPPKPSPDEVDKTIEGVDVNKNYIRDDVELAIFEMYPDEENIKLRAASLQYAMALQLYLTHVFDEGTYLSVLKKENLAYSCLNDQVPSNIPEFKDNNDFLEWGKIEKNKDFFNREFRREQNELDKLTDFVYDLVLNTESRNLKFNFNSDNFMSSYTVPGLNNVCDISF